MTGAIFEFLKDQIKGEKPLHPVERRMAKRYVKERLKRMFPDLRRDPKALEEAYRNLSMEPRIGTGKGGATVFEILLPGHLE